MCVGTVSLQTFSKDIIAKNTGLWDNAVNSSRCTRGSKAQITRTAAALHPNDIVINGQARTISDIATIIKFQFAPELSFLFLHRYGRHEGNKDCSVKDLPNRQYGVHICTWKEMKYLTTLGKCTTNYQAIGLIVCSFLT